MFTDCYVTFRESGAEAQVVTLSPTSPTMTQYSPLTFTCETQSTNTGYVIWGKRVGNADVAIGTIIIRGDNDCSPPYVGLAPNSTLYSYACPATNRLTLTIRNVSRTENGVRWKCQVQVNGTKVNSNEETITVQDGPDRPLCKTINFNITSVLKVVIGTTFTIFCTVDSNPAPFSWQWSPYGGSSQQLGFTNIQRIQGREYTLQVWNRMTVSGSSSPVDGIPPDVPTLHMSGKEVTGTVKIIEGNSKTFNCSTESNPVSSYSWIYPRGSSSNRILQVNNFRSESYDGDYTCQVQNRIEPSFGNSKENVSMATISVDVLLENETELTN
ncbi:LOW QUALITY PROTEIN: hypothetical protein MAR_021676 [Mya arenaria]|uniref:Ig-like domain-containing protein n=1 Tax=Mya arenaria TaxID=6604 RepID=A0ABY7E8H7_MYAAR|nr:LOW QUALITY PROTEIN: hypothetical protein MAR_021676 [Mya arenaria]